MLEAAITKTLGAFNLEARLSTGSGQVTALFGPSGAGKSTLASCLAGLIDPDSGHISLDGTTLFNAETGTRLAPERRRIGYVFQDARLFPHLSVHGNLDYGARRTPPSDRRVDFDHVVELLDIGALLARRPRTLSGGEKQWVAFGRAVLTSPKLLIMDEPSSGLDPLVQREFQTMMREVAADGRTVFLSSHTLSEVQRVADRVGIIRHGRLIAVEAVASLRSKAIRTVELMFDSPAEASVFEAVAGVRDVTIDDHQVRLSFDGHMESLLAVVADHYTLVDINTEEADLEEIFLTYYRDGTD